MMNARRCASLLFLTAALVVVGCKTDSATKQAENSGKSAGSTAPLATSVAPVNPATAGAIEGTIHFKGVPPKRLKIDMSMDPACAMSGDTNMTKQYVIDDGKVANVYVYIKSGISPTSVSPSYTVTLDQKGCQYEPHVIAIQQGGSVVFKNSDPTMHNVHIVEPDGSSVDVTEGPLGAPQTKQFTTPQVMTPVRCNNHPWMNAFLNVAPNPYFAVTGPDGKFTIQGLPPGTYTLAAVQEKMGEQDIQVTVKPKSTEKADFTFSAK
jgi:plastocyanin